MTAEALDKFLLCITMILRAALFETIYRGKRTDLAAQLPIEAVSIAREESAAEGIAYASGINDLFFGDSWDVNRIRACVQVRAILAACDDQILLHAQGSDPNSSLFSWRSIQIRNHCRRGTVRLPCHAQVLRLRVAAPAGLDHTDREFPTRGIQRGISSSHRARWVKRSRGRVFASRSLRDCVAEYPIAPG